MAGRETPIERRTLSYYALKGVRYAITSFLALFAGYLVAGKTVHPEDACLLLAHFLFTLPFFISYLCRFADVVENTEQLGTIRRNQGESIGFAIVYACTVYILAVLAYAVIAKHLPPVTLAVGVLGHCGLFLAYGLFLFFRSTLAENTLIRHTLVWPVVLSIGTTFYLGLSWQDLQKSLIPLLPIVALFTFFLVSELLTFTMTWFLVSSVAALIAFAIVGLQLQTFRVHASGILFAVVLAAYLAVFEGWGLAATIGHANEAKALKYHTALGAAILLSGLAIPILYLGTALESIFVFGFAVHAIVAYAIWYGASPYSFSVDKWLTIKTVVGGFLLFIITVDALWPIGRDRPLPLNPRDLNEWLLLPFSLGLYAGLRRALKTWRRSGFLAMFGSRSAFLGAVPILSVPGLFLSFEIYQRSTGSKGAASQVYCVYAVFVLLSLLAIAARYVKGDGSRFIMQIIIGILLTTRLFTSSIVALLVFCAATVLGVPKAVAASSSFPFMLAAMGGFCLNDICDRQQDMMNKPYRAIPSGRLRLGVVMIMAWGLLGCSLCTTILCGLSATQKTLQLIVLVGMVVYNWIVRRAGWLKGVYTATLATVPIIFIGSSWGQMGYVIPFAGIVLLFMTGRETLMDVVDESGDRRAGVRTIPVMIGGRRAQFVGFGLLYVGLACLLPWSIHVGVGGLGVLLACATTCCTVIHTVAWFRYGGFAFRRTLNRALWLPMLAGAYVFVMGLTVT
jgi:4-hydroxybenzoate polyprenyltransferase